MSMMKVRDFIMEFLICQSCSLLPKENVTDSPKNGKCHLHTSGTGSYLIVTGSY